MVSTLRVLEGSSSTVLLLFTTVHHCIMAVAHLGGRPSVKKKLVEGTLVYRLLFSFLLDRILPNTSPPKLTYSWLFYSNLPATHPSIYYICIYIYNI